MFHRMIDLLTSPRCHEQAYEPFEYVEEIVHRFYVNVINCGIRDYLNEGLSHF